MFFLCDLACSEGLSSKTDLFLEKSFVECVLTRPIGCGLAVWF